MMPVIAWTRPKLNRLKREYGKARQTGAETFKFDGLEFVTGYARYLIEFLEKSL